MAKPNTKPPLTKTYCSYCGQEETKVLLGLYETLTGKQLTRRECHKVSCEVGKKNLCLNLGGHFYPERPWYQWLFPYDVKYATCTKCGHVY